VKEKCAGEEKQFIANVELNLIISYNLLDPLDNKMIKIKALIA
jgi:hypothetical protein